MKKFAAILLAMLMLFSTSALAEGSSHRTPEVVQGPKVALFLHHAQ